jgi:hypothetical protein
MSNNYDYALEILKKNHHLQTAFHSLQQVANS